MVLYQIGPELSLVDHCTEGQVLVLLTSQELSQHPELKCLEGVLQHTPLARDARVCKAEARRDCLCGTIVTPRYTKEGERIAFGYMLTASGGPRADQAAWPGKALAGEWARPTVL